MSLILPHACACTCGIESLNCVYMGFSCMSRVHSMIPPFIYSPAHSCYVIPLAWSATHDHPIVMHNCWAPAVCSQVVVAMVGASWFPLLVLTIIKACQSTSGIVFVVAWSGPSSTPHCIIHASTHVHDSPLLLIQTGDFIPFKVVSQSCHSSFHMHVHVLVESNP